MRKLCPRFFPALGSCSDTEVVWLVWPLPVSQSPVGRPAALSNDSTASATILAVARIEQAVSDSNQIAESLSCRAGSRLPVARSTKASRTLLLTDSKTMIGCSGAAIHDTPRTNHYDKLAL